MKVQFPRSLGREANIRSRDMRTPSSGITGRAPRNNRQRASSTYAMASNTGSGMRIEGIGLPVICASSSHTSSSRFSAPST